MTPAAFLRQADARTVGALLVGVFLLVSAGAWAGVNLLDEAHDEVARPLVAELHVGLVHEQCKSGWKSHRNEGPDGADVLSCERTVDGVEWLVVLKPDGMFDHAAPNPGSEFVFDEDQVPQ